MERELLDRRANLRFPLHLPVRYQRLGSGDSEWAVGETVDISSSGLLFTTDEPLSPGQAVHAYISWPAVLDRHVALKLVVKGSVVRTGRNPDSVAFESAVAFERHEFRTASSTE